MAKTLGQQLTACGRHRLPQSLSFKDTSYRLVRIFKHDFFAATALYQVDSLGPSPAITSPPAKIVLKVARRGDLLGLPLAWLGRAICRHECALLRRLQGLPGAPRLLDTCGEDAFIYQYIEGLTLQENPNVPDDFFDQLQLLLNRIHARRIAYMDMNKRTNIIIDPNNTPHLIDFQVSCCIPERLLGSKRLAQAVFGRLANADRYHLLKHKRRLRPDLMDETQISQSRRISFLIALHRLYARPFIWLRRRGLSYLSHKDLLANPKSTHRNKP